jgi:hypothetical protein
VNKPTTLIQDNDALHSAVSIPSELFSNRYGKCAGSFVVWKLLDCFRRRQAMVNGEKVLWHKARPRKLSPNRCRWTL